jgi:hypothetical protein
MRLDYFHTGGQGREIVSLDQVVSDGPWAGSLTRLLDGMNLGAYFFEVSDAGTHRVLFSRGFSSLYGEWEETGEAKAISRTFHESLRFPWPKAPVQVVLKKRSGGVFREVWTTLVDPDSRFVNPADAPPRGEVWAVFESGTPTEKADVVIVPAGYTQAQMPKFHADALRLCGALFSEEPFKSRKADFNVRAVDIPAFQSGVNRPQVGSFRRGPISAEYNTLDSERYLLSHDERALRDALSGVPYEFVFILANEKQYGGGGIFNFQAAGAADTEFSGYLIVHEFGHHFADLADEYYMSPSVYSDADSSPVEEPWNPNVTLLKDPSKLKWRDLVEDGTPVPTPWDKEAYEDESRRYLEKRQELIRRKAPEGEFDALFKDQEKIDSPMLSGMRHSGKTGAFEGALYKAKGFYRPQTDCIMFSRDKVGFCRVCRRAIERVIDLYSRP